jgi:hypothetical protein
LEFLRDKASDRKLALFGSACHRRISPQAAIRWEQLRRGGHVPEPARVTRPTTREQFAATLRSVEEAVTIATCHLGKRSAIREAAIQELKVQCQLLRCIFGHPFRTATLAPEWLAWNAGTALKIARAVYEERAFDRLPILADALEDAGCDDADILAHCRGGGPHVRGCWVVDLILGKQ